MAYRQARPCPICESASDPCYAAGHFHLYRCVNCRTAFVDPVPSDEFLNEYYSTYHLTASAGGVYDDVESRMQADFPAKLDLVKRHATASAGGKVRLLDVGCGKGFFVKAAADAGLDAEGCDLSDSGVKYAVEQLGVKAHAGHINRLKSQLGTFDAATFWATIEHLPDPIGLMRDVRDILKPGGLFLLDTGIGDDWLDRLVPGNVQWYDPPQHLFVFSGDGLAKAVEKAGFRVLAHDRCFERSASRKLIRNLRNGVTAAILRFGAELGRLSCRGFNFTRFPMGNLQSIVAQRI
ncbi:MAG: Ubiquinone biosynthesis O-methyltransferase [Phycisphaerales bacterium]|nr:Ubiquinone biosynthesis O-methyltransferase [Phycisphaerales bacterium]